MASYNKFQSFIEDVHNGVHNLSSDTLKVAFTTNANAPSATDGQLSDISDITPTNLDSVELSVISSEHTAGEYALKITDKVITATGAFGPFQWVVIYNDTATNDEVIGYFDYGSEISLANSETFTLDFDVDGLFTNT